MYNDEDGCVLFSFYTECPIYSIPYKDHAIFIHLGNLLLFRLIINADDNAKLQIEILFSLQIFELTSN